MGVTAYAVKELREVGEGGAAKSGAREAEAVAVIADLEVVASAWPKLPEAVRQSILLLVNASGRQDSDGYLGNHTTDTVTIVSAVSYEPRQNCLADCLADSPCLDSELRAIVQKWRSMPPPVRAAIVELVRSVSHNGAHG